MTFTGDLFQRGTLVAPMVSVTFWVRQREWGGQLTYPLGCCVEPDSGELNLHDGRTFIIVIKENFPAHGLANFCGSGGPP